MTNISKWLKSQPVWAAIFGSLGLIWAGYLYEMGSDIYRHQGQFMTQLFQWILSMPPIPPSFLFGISIGLLLSYFWDKIWYPNRQYQDVWLHHETFSVWQAACLFAGEEPKLPIAHGTKPYPYLQLVSAVEEDKILVHDDPGDGTAWKYITRGELAKYSREKSLPSKFPF